MIYKKKAIKNRQPEFDWKKDRKGKANFESIVGGKKGQRKKTQHPSGEKRVAGDEFRKKGSQSKGTIISKKVDESYAAKEKPGTELKSGSGQKRQTFFIQQGARKKKD